MGEVTLRIPAWRDPPRLHAREIRPATIDLWLSRPTSNPPVDPPATAIVAAFTDSELPHVEKNAVDAPTASAINSSARAR
jgi:hypothetical protein